MIERDMYQKRLKQGKPIGLHEFMYPLMQGYDSVAIRADVEFGGSDQEFNLLIGRTMQERFGQKPQDILTTPLLIGTDGRKMSKTYNNYIGVSESPSEMFGKVMSAIDDIIVKYFKLATDVPMKEIDEIERGIKNCSLNPRDAKARLGREIVTIYHSKADAIAAEQEFERIFKDKQKPSKIPEFRASKKVYLIPDLLVESGLVKSKAEAKRLVEQRGVKIDDKVIADWQKSINVKNGMIIQVGKRKFKKIK
jgi:tyrosyl-tRNA synthetase